MVSAPSAGARSVPVPADEFHPIRNFFRILGPGLITGASDDDPSGIATYLIAGASLGYAILWTTWVCLPLMAAVQFICAKIGMVSGRGLAGVLRRHYARTILYPVVLGLVVVNTINAGVDLEAIASGINLLIPVSEALLIPLIAAAIIVLQIWGSYRLIARTFKWLTLALFAYIGSAFCARPDWWEVLRGTVIPTMHFDNTYLATLVAVLGTTISPYLFFWQASNEVEEEKSLGRSCVQKRRGATPTELRHAAWDVNIGMLFSQVVMYFIILAAGATLFQAGKTNIETAAEGAEALRPLAGNMATELLAIGLIGAGVLAVPVLTGSSAYAVCDAFGWKSGLDEKPAKAKAFYAIIAGSTLVGVLINYLGVNPVKALFWTAVLNGILAPPMMVFLMLIANNRRVMGEHINSRLSNVLGWLATVLMFAAAIGLFVTWG